MVPDLRAAFNAQFSAARYAAFLEDLDRVHPGAIEFRVAETPVFVDAAFTQKMLSTCEYIVDQVIDPRFREMTDRAIPPNLRVPHENGHPHFIAFDFGICRSSRGEYEPQLIEMQGFPTLFAFQVLLPELSARHFPAPEGYSCYLGGQDRASYLALLKRILLGNHPAEEVILLEIFPHRQKTRIDFYCTTDYTGIRPVCLTELIREGRRLYYLRDGKKTPVRRIYNRLIFDDLLQQSPEVQQKGNLLFEDLDVEWVPHPNWFYRISKFTLPFLRHPYIPATYFLSEVKQIPADLDHYVLKPLFSFAGQGVVIDVTREDLDRVPDPENWILQRKVPYAEAIQTPGEPAKAEIRIFYFWEDGKPRPVPTNNLARLSKGKMIGVRYNKDKVWVGGSFCWFER
ncbi:MAG TPA: hypothetical protein VG870_04170 [Chitinophagaceae bacterium]|nr:hypothetical protein [Chitinophagaceae bacterium]